MNRRPTAAVAAVATLLLAALLSGCGSNEDPGSTADQATGQSHNEADVAFVTEMIPHHAQALVMVDMTLGRELDPEFRELTEDIRAAQTPEIETMVDWLQEWGEPVPETPRDHANAHGDGHGMGDGGGHGTGDGGMPGMDGADLGSLGAAQAEHFEQMWLQMMIEHHRGAVEMARAEQEDGLFEPAVDLARRIERTQSAEIERMRTLLAS
jgi:uncharacterized protein (DUF305 family)